MGPAPGAGPLYPPRAQNTRLNALLAGLSAPPPWTRLNVADDCPASPVPRANSELCARFSLVSTLASSSTHRRRATGYCARVAFPSHLQASAARALGGLRRLDAMIVCTNAWDASGSR